jgi:hypothetical protein
VTYTLADLMLSGMLLLGVAVLAFFAWRYRAWLLEHGEYVAGGLVLLGGLLGIAFLTRRQKPAPPPPERRPSPELERLHAEAKAAEEHAKGLHAELEEAKATAPDEAEAKRRVIEIGKREHRKANGKPS